ncbi:MAG: PAS domain S-box protein [Ferruginibacter sp.]
MNRPTNNIAAILDRISDGVIALDINWCFTFANEKGGAYFDETPVSLVGKNIWQQFPGEVDGEFYKACHAAMEHQHTLSVKTFQQKNECWFQNRIYPSADGVSIIFNETSVDEMVLKELEKAQVELKESNERFLRITTATSDMLWDWNIDTGELWWNESYDNLFGHQDNSTIHHISSWIKNVHPDDRERVKAGIDRVLQSREKDLNIGDPFWTDEYRYLKADGTVLCIYDRGKIIYNDAGKACRMTGTMMDITERINAEHELKLSNERFLLVTKATNDMIWDWNILTGDLWWNDNYYELFGHDKNLVFTIDSWIENLHPDDRERVAESIYRVTNSGEKYWAEEYRYLKKDGSVLNVHDRGHVLYDKSGKPCRMIGSMLDITDRIKIEEALKESEVKYRNLFEIAGEGLIVHHIDGTILDVNLTSVSFSGYAKEELKRLNVTDLLFPEDLVKLPIPIATLMAGETAFNRRRVKTKLGNVRIMDVSSKMLPDGNVIAIIRDVTEKSEADNALSNSENRFRVLTGNAPTGIFETNDAGETTYVNDKMTEYTGRSFDELLGMNWIEAVHEEDREQVVENWKERFAQKIESASEYRIIHKDGSIRWVSGRSVPLRNKDDQHIGYLGTLSDITTEKLAQLALKESEEKYRSLIEQASDAIYITDTSGKIVTVNSSACKLSQYSENELLQMSVYDLLNPEDVEKNPLKFEELRNGNTVVTERTIKGRSGSYITMETTAKMLSDGRILVFARDITERIKAAQALKESEEKYRLLFQNSPLPMWVNEVETNRNVDVNEAAIKHYGYTREEFLRLTVYSIRPEADWENYTKLILNQRSGRQTSGVWRHLKKDKSIINVEVTAHDILYNNKTARLIAAIDVTEKINYEKDLRETSEQLRELAGHLQKIREEERRRIGREIHDELGQQLTAIKMDIAWLEKKTVDESSPFKGKLKNIINLLDGSNQSVRRILAELSPGIIDNHGLVAAIQNQNRQFTSVSGIPVKFTTTASSIQLSQEIANCVFRVYQESLTNILRYANAGKVISSLKIIGDQIELRVKDNGTGFDLDTVKKKKSFGILGMKERVISQKGKFELQSKSGHGTLIKVTVPYIQ